MIKFENVEVFGWEAAIRGMRNSWDSHEKSDSRTIIHYNNVEEFVAQQYEIGDTDLTLMRNLALGGASHAKYRRYINVTVDITAPLYWWKEFDTYKVGTVANSESTMHTIMKKPFTRDMFSFDKVGNAGHWSDVCNTIVEELNKLRGLYLTAVRDNESDSARAYWKILIELLPSSFNQKRTVQLNYEVLSKIWKERKSHKLSEWSGILGFCQNFIQTLPYSEGIIWKV